MGFLGCDTRRDKNYAPLVPKWSDDPEKSIVMSGTPCTFWDYVRLAKFWLVVELQLEMYLATMVTKVARFLMRVMEGNEYA